LFSSPTEGGRRIHKKSKKKKKLYKKPKDTRQKN